MEESHDSLKEELLDINDTLMALLQGIQERPDFTDERFHDWKKGCADIRQQIMDEVFRVAVIGPIKSGKSTFINSLFKGDYLKRGAGVVTSIVTRIRSGKNLKARLFFKTWSEVNADIEQALVLFPSWDRQTTDNTFDIRRAEDRKALTRALDKLSPELRITDGTFNSNSVLLSLYLKGYDRFSTYISTDSSDAEFSGKRFTEHQEFAGEDSLAVYLKDIELEIDSRSLDSTIEIADCQGSDSPNPHHLVMIQDYLMRAHFIVYVISSRTGLRQADVHFLTMLKTMGISENILFIVNCDLSEHESQEDMLNIVNKIKEELALVQPAPVVYAFSALFNLFRSMSDGLSKRDGLRLAHWEEEADMVSFSQDEKKKFESVLNSKLSQERSSLLLKNHIERINIMVSGILRWIETNKELMEKDASGASSAIETMGKHHERMMQMRTLIKSTLNGAKDEIMIKIKSEIDKFFNVHTGGAISEATQFINDHEIAVEKYRSKLEASGFSGSLYLLFQEFKQAVDSFMAQTINPEIARFSSLLEQRIQKALDSVAQPFYSMAIEDIEGLKASVSNQAQVLTAGSAGQRLLSLDSLKFSSGITLPSSSTTLNYSSKIRAGAAMRLGLYSMTKFFKKVIKKSPEDEREEQMKALQDGVRLIKGETQEAIKFHFENYRENFKFQYIAKLLDAATEHLYTILLERYQSYDTDIQTLEQMVEKKGAEREEIINFLKQVESDARTIQDHIEKFRNRINKAA
ncbi:MAG: hypothetical protein AMK70_12125 [Nitrospira bacterium SG8_35_1]|nr:MAG: hypothetical protein AMK70_12125 [Nitrospira bacterium SG8_35_1]